MHVHMCVHRFVYLRDRVCTKTKHCRVPGSAGPDDPSGLATGPWPLLAPRPAIKHSKTLPGPWPLRRPREFPVPVTLRPSRTQLLSFPTLPLSDLIPPAAMAANASFVSPTADAQVAQVLHQFDTTGFLSSALTGFTLWKLAVTLVAAAVAYDQCKHHTPPSMPARHGFLMRAQSNTSGTRVPLSALHGRFPSSVPFSSRSTQTSKSITKNGRPAL
jgi:hypothetical protein